MDANTIEEFRKQLRSLEREIFEQLKQGTSCCGVSLAQCHALLEIGESNLTSISDLAQTLRLDKSTLSRTIEGLVRIGLVSREINPKDRRYMCVTLTEQGKKTYQLISDHCNQYYQSVFTHIHEGQHTQIIESLVTLAEAMHHARENRKASDCIDIAEIHSNKDTES